MDESVALDSSKQKDFVKSVRGLKKLLKKDKKPEQTEVIKEETKVIKDKTDEVKKEGKVKKSKSRGLVYLSHIPHGFYEQQMTEYFKQFGVVTNARVIRSRRTGNSKGFAYVEFKEPAVAEIVAETMNNYLMGKRLIKAAYIPPDKQRKNAQRKKWNSQKNPSSDERLMFKKKHNADKTDTEELKMAKKLLSNLSKTKQKLTDLGINYDFFKPVDVPEALKDKLDEIIPQTEVKPKSEEKLKVLKSEPEEIKVNENTNKRKKKQLKHKQVENNESPDISETLVKKSLVKIDQGKHKQSHEENNKMNKKQQKEKEQKSQKAGVKGLGNYVSIKESVDSDSSIDFDSDEFEKMIERENDDELSSGDESSESEHEEIQEMTKTVSKKTAKGSKNKGIAFVDINKQKKHDKENLKAQSVKRKPAQSAPVTAKKAKFEKQNSKRPLNQVIKKRK
ncbi:MKI67 FHA domain-interacting nucleolar phosphoprotein-like isoform X2 [Maniola hyperantus]|uniref:MKI67 FHA domain-interacting nucleolar phosphoprotein-like isoform X2 n=1 Tax=Aphantopus hyperantus TaxID=2795564 RepID=UPI001568C481|nr:MKI67 FHA domain-interacting nucleolar phosphoprotein-like isoform X2 [Maniola hyperantus]